MSERKNLTITQVEEIKKVGKNQVPKLSFRAKDGDKEYTYFTFKSSIFDLIKTGQTINADVETTNREWEGNQYTDRRVVQVYVDGQPIGGQKQGYRGKSPEELDQQARVMVLAYAKDLAAADKIPISEITNQADAFYTWVKKTDSGVKAKAESQVSHSQIDELEFLDNEPKTDEAKTPESTAPGKVQNVTELKTLMAKHKVGTREAYEILSINSFMEVVDPDEAWVKIKEAKKI